MPRKWRDYDNSSNIIVKWILVTHLVDADVKLFRGKIWLPHSENKVSHQEVLYRIKMSIT